MDTKERMFCLRVRFRCHQEDGTEEVQDMRALAALSGTAQALINMAYAEPGEGAARVVLTLAPDGAVLLDRRGEVTSHARYRTGETDAVRYDFGGQRMSIPLTAQEVIWQIGPLGGQVLLRYALTLQDAAQHHTVTYALTPVPATGPALFLQARDLLVESLGQRFGFLRWGDREDMGAALVTDAPKVAAMRGMDASRAMEDLIGWGWRVEQTGGLWWLSAPQAALAQALASRHTEPEAGQGWSRDPAIAALQALCGALLRQPCPVGPVSPEAAAMVQVAWRATAGTLEQVTTWAAQLTVSLAQGMRQGAVAGQYACGVQLQGWLKDRQADVPREALCSHIP